MGKLSYSDLTFIEMALTFYAIHERREMKRYPSVYCDEEIKRFSSSVQDLIDKIRKLEEEE